MALLLAGLLLASCSSQKKEKEVKPDYTSLRWEQRINKQIKDPFAIKSPFQTEVYNAKGTVKTESYKTDKYRGGRPFSGADDKFKAGPFAQADKASKSGQKAFSGADDKSRFGNDTFKTSQNRFDGKSSSDADKASAFGNDTFNTDGNAAALENVKNIKRPQIRNEPYTENEVRNLLNKS
jgi:hypothetical protein